MSELKKTYTTDRSKMTFVRDLREIIYKYEHNFQSLQQLKVNFSSDNSCHGYSSCIHSAGARERKRDAQRNVWNGRKKNERERNGTQRDVWRGQKVNGAIEWERFNQEPHKSPLCGHPGPGSPPIPTRIPSFFPRSSGQERPRLVRRPSCPLRLPSFASPDLASCHESLCRTQATVLIMRRMRSRAFCSRYQYLRHC